MTSAGVLEQDNTELSWESCSVKASRASVSAWIRRARAVSAEAEHGIT